MVVPSLPALLPGTVNVLAAPTVQLLCHFAPLARSVAAFKLAGERGRSVRKYSGHSQSG